MAGWPTRVITVPLSVLDLAPVAKRHAPPARRCGTPPSWPGAPRSWATAGSGWPSTTTCRRSPAPRRRCCWRTWPRTTVDDPARVGRGDAAQPRAAGGGRAVRHAGGAAPGPDRPGHRPGAGHRPGDRAGAAAHHGGAVGGGLPAGAGRPDRTTSAATTPGPIIATPGPRRAARRVAARLQRFQRPARRAARVCRSRSRTTSARRTPCRRWRCTGRTSGRRSWLDEPYAMVAVNAVCAETDERAEWLAGPSALSFLRLRSGRPEPLATPGGGGGVPVHRDRAGVRAGSAATVRRWARRRRCAGS